MNAIGPTVKPWSTIYTDDHRAYNAIKKMPHHHETVSHSTKEYVNGMAHTNGIESFWALMKRGYHGTYHHWSAKHLDRYVREFSGRHNIRELDTVDQMSSVAQEHDRKAVEVSGTDGLRKTLPKLGCFPYSFLFPDPSYLGLVCILSFCYPGFQSSVLIH